MILNFFEKINVYLYIFGQSIFIYQIMELCLIRLANPDESLESLRKLYKYEITKSGLNHRFNKLIAKAEELKKAKNVQPRSIWF